MPKFLISFVVLSFVLVSCQSKDSKPVQVPEDKYIWLEEVESPKSLDWVKQKNDKTLTQLQAKTNYNTYYNEALKILEAKDRIPFASLRNRQVFNFWKDEKNIRGLWRRTSIEDYNKKNPKWTVILDLDQLAKKEKENWIWKGAECLPPEYNRCLLSLSRGGKDAVVVREFDIKTQSFVKNGFYLKEAKSNVAWFDKDTVIVGTNFGEGTLTDSGYPRTLRVYKRGNDLSKAPVLFEGDKKHMMVWAFRNFDSSKKYLYLGVSKTFYTSELTVTDLKGFRKKIELPESIEFKSEFKGHFIISLRKPWKINSKDYAQGSLLAVEMAPLLKDGSYKVQEIYVPSEKSALKGVSSTKDFLLVEEMVDVKSRIFKFELKSNQFVKSLLDIDKNVNARILTSSAKHNDFYVYMTGFLDPIKVLFSSEKNGIKTVKSQAERFSSKNLIVKQEFAKSFDGTKVPYFLIHPKNIKLDSKNPTLLYGYGGFEVSLSPFYWSTAGKIWLERGGVLAVANIRGGGEYGPRWHQAALKQNRHVAFNDFISVGEDLIRKKITSTNHLGIKGGSNGGLLVGASAVKKPSLFKAVICQVPLLDMIRYSKLLAGASWMGEYGDPDKPEMRKSLLSYSPYHNLEAGKKYPEIFFITSTKDDRVHPGHARKMAAKMDEFGFGHYYYENTEGGHSASANNKQRAKMTALEYVYLDQMLRENSK